MGDDRAAIVDQVIRERRTDKVLANEPFPVQDARQTVEELVATAGWAPFHTGAARVHTEHGALASMVPGRLHMLDAAGCRALRLALLARGEKAETKVLRMLGAATALIQATWLPNPSKGEPTGMFEATEDNLEHIAAAGAAVQNLLLAATARGIPSYWSSGGVLRKPDEFGLLGIPTREILIGAVFLFPADTRDAEVSPGSHRDKRGAPSDWSRWVELDLPSAG